MSLVQLSLLLTYVCDSTRIMGHQPLDFFQGYELKLGHYLSTILKVNTGGKFELETKHGLDESQPIADSTA